MSGRLALYLVGMMVVVAAIFGRDEPITARDVARATTTTTAELLPPLALEKVPHTVTVEPGSVTEANDMGDPAPPPATSTTASVPVASSDGRWVVSSTVYCLGGTTASGQPVHDGVVAVHSSRFDELEGTRWHVVEGPPEILGRTFTVLDHGPGADFDVWMGNRPDCPTWGLNDYGRQRAVVVPA